MKTKQAQTLLLSPSTWNYATTMLYEALAKLVMQASARSTGPVQHNNAQHVAGCITILCNSRWLTNTGMWCTHCDQYRHVVYKLSAVYKIQHNCNLLRHAGWPPDVTSALNITSRHTLLVVPSNCSTLGHTLRKGSSRPTHGHFLQEITHAQGPICASGAGAGPPSTCLLSQTLESSKPCSLACHQPVA